MRSVTEKERKEALGQVTEDGSALQIIAISVKRAPRIKKKKTADGPQYCMRRSPTSGPTTMARLVERAK